jgi:hypothetical protein
MTRLRFSIRDLLWLTALCAVLVAWWVDHRGMAEQHEKDQLELQIQWGRNKEEPPASQ